MQKACRAEPPPAAPAAPPAAVSSAQLTPADVDVCDVVEAAREGRRPLDYVVREVQARLGPALHRWAGEAGGGGVEVNGAA